MDYYDRILKISQEKERPTRRYTPSNPEEDTDKEEAAEASVRTQVIKALQDQIIQFATNASNLKTKLDSAGYLFNLSKSRGNQNALKDSDFTAWVNVMKMVGSKSGKSDGLFGSRTINGINGASQISGLFIDYFTSIKMSFGFDSSDNQKLADCVSKNPTENFKKQSPEYKANLAKEITPVLQKLNDATLSILNSKDLDSFVKTDDRDSFRISHSGKNTSDINVEKNIDTYVPYGTYAVDVSRWTNSREKAFITIKDVIDRAAFDAWKAANSIKTTGQNDNDLIAAIKATMEVIEK